MTKEQKADLSKIGHKDYMDTMWWHFLPLYIFIALAIINLVLMVFAGGNAGAILSFVLSALLIGLLIWWLCDIGQLGWAWFVLLLPLILAMATGVVAGGVTAGLFAYDMGKTAISSSTEAPASA
jgi:hypothetical protein